MPDKSKCFGILAIVIDPRSCCHVSVETTNGRICSNITQPCHKLTAWQSRHLRLKSSIFGDRLITDSQIGSNRSFSVFEQKNDYSTKRHETRNPLRHKALQTPIFQIDSGFSSYAAVPVATIRRGNCTVTVLPQPKPSLATSIVPPWSLTIRWLIHIPNPVPLPSRRRV